jgi:fructose-bisphosphate aldolase, class II
MFTPSLPLLQQAYGHHAIGAFSVNTIEQIRGVLLGAKAADSPVLIQVSKRAREYAGADVLESAAHAIAKDFPQVTFGIHLDHGDEDHAHACIDSGLYASVMVDASMFSFEENIAITRRVVQHARERGITTEAELGRLGGKEDDIEVAEKDAFFTDPAMAAEFVQRTGVDSLAVAIGTSHGLKKFSGEESLNLARLEAIQSALFGYPLVLHGASMISSAEVLRINQAGGRLDTTSQGVPSEQYLKAIRRGITKINIDSDSRLLMTRVYREYMREHPETVDFRLPGEVFIQAMADLVQHHLVLFGNGNHRRSAGIEK